MISGDKYLYFRKVSDVADDDAYGDSVSFPVSSIVSMQYTATVVDIYFRNLFDQVGGWDDNVDFVKLAVGTATGDDVIESIVKEIQTGEDHTIVVYDEVTDATVDSNISAITSINIDQS
jgi:hypothetical protein